MAGWLIAPAHHAIGHDGATILHHHAGDDGMQRAFIGRDAIRVAFLQAETKTAILQHDTGFFRKDAGTKTLEQRIDEGARIAILIHHAKIDRVLVLIQIALTRCRQFRQRSVIADQARQALQVIRIQQLFDWHIHLRGIGQEGIAVPIGHARGFDVPMQARRGKRPAFGCGQMGQRAQDLQRMQARPVGWALIHLHPAPGDGNGGHEFRSNLAIGEIFFGMQAAHFTQRGHNIGGHFALIESRRAAGRNGAQGLRQFWLTEARTQLEGRAIIQEPPRRCRVFQQFVNGSFPIRPNARRDGEAFFGIMDRRLQDAIKPELAMAAVQQFPSRNRARHRHRMGRGVFQLGRTGGAQCLRRRSAWRTARTIQRNHRAAAGRHVKAEAIPANAGRARFNHALHGTSGDGRIHGIAAGAQDFKRSKSGLGHGGCGHSVGAIGGAAASKVKITHRGSGFHQLQRQPLSCPLSRAGKSPAGSGMVPPGANLD